MNIVKILKPIAGTLFKSFGQAVLTDAILSPLKSFARVKLSRRLSKAFKDYVKPVLDKWVAYFTKWDTRYLPPKLDDKVDAWIEEKKQELYKTWGDEEKIRTVLRILENPEELRDWREKLSHLDLKMLLKDAKKLVGSKFEENAGEVWAKLKTKTPKEILNILNTWRRKEVVDVVKNKVFEETGMKISAKLIAPRVDASVKHDKEKSSAERTEALRQKVRRLLVDKS